jgi:predicted dehydrogenase
MNIAIIGYKNHAARLISIIENMEICSKITIFHPDKKKLINHFKHKGSLGLKMVLTSSLNDILDSSCIFIASPTPTHFEYIVKILPLFKGYIFCEKPPCYSLDEAHNLSLINLKDKERIYFNFNYRFSELAKLCKNALINNTYGKLISLEFYSSHGIAFQSKYKNNWRNTSNGVLENLVGNVGIHYIDLVNYLLNGAEISSVNSIKVSAHSRFSDSALITISSKECLPSTVYLSYAAPFQNTAKFTFSDAVVELLNGTVSIRHPRKTFDEAGMFKSPPNTVIVNYGSSRDYYDQALLESIIFFITKVKNKSKLSAEDFDCSIETTKSILSLGSS